MKHLLLLAAFSVLGFAQTPRDYIASLTGDVTAGPGPTAAATLATVNATPGSCGNATHVCVIVTDGKGRVIGLSLAAISGGGGGGVWGSITGTLASQTDLQTALSAKQPAGNYLTGLTGDGTASGAGSDAFTLATVNSGPGTCGDATHVCQFTTNGKGLVTGQSALAVTAVNAITQLTGDVTAGPGTGSRAATLATVNSGPGSCGDATHVCQVTTNGKGLVTAQTTVSISAGGTGTVTHTTGVLTSGELIVGNGSGDIEPGNLSGDISTAGSTAATLATVNSNVGTFGSSSLAPVITVNAKGLITAVTTASISGGGGGTNNWSAGVLASIPGTCTPGSGVYLYFATDQPAGQQEYQCSASNVWTQIVNLGGSGALAYIGGSLDIVTSVVARLPNSETFTGVQTFSQSIVHGVETVAFSATPNFNVSAGDLQTITLTGNVTGATFSGLSAGISIKLQVCQDATGSRTFAWSGSNVHGFLIGSTASLCSLVALDSFDGVNLYTEGVQNQ